MMGYLTGISYGIITPWISGSIVENEMDKKNTLSVWMFPFGIYDLVQSLNLHWAVAFLLLCTVGLEGAQLAQPPIGLKITKIKTASGQKYKVGETPLQNQARIYIDRDHLKFTNIPKIVSGLSYLMTANSDHKSKGKAFLTFTTDRSVRLWVCRDSRGDQIKKGKAPKWLSDNFERMETRVETNEANMGFFILYRGNKDLPKGRCTLGGNADPPAAGQMNNYVVLFAAPINGDQKQNLSAQMTGGLSQLWGWLKTR